MKRLLLTMLVLAGFVAMDASAKETSTNETPVSVTPANKKSAPKVYAADANKDGKVSKEEFLAHAKKNAEKKGNEFNQKRAENIFAKRDTNKDGFLSAADSVKKTAPNKEKDAGTAED